MINKSLLNMLGKNKKYLFIELFVSIIGLISNVIITAGFCLLMANAVGETAFKSINCYIIIATFLIIKCVTILISGKLKRMLGSEAKLNLRRDAYDKLLNNGITNKKGENASMTQMIIEGVEQIDTYYTAYLPSFFYAMIAPILLFIMCLFLEWRVGVVLIACLPLIPMSIVMVSKYAKKVFAKYWGKYLSMGNNFLDTVEGMKEIKIFSCENDKRIDNNKKAEEFRKITMKVLVMQLCSLTIIDLVAFTGAGFAIVMALSQATSDISILAPFTALFLILISSEFFLPMMKLASSFHVAMNGATAGEKIHEFINRESDKWGEETTETCDNLKFDNLTFSYDDKRNILQNISMNFPIGTTAIVGESGSGKSTCVSLLLGAHSPNSGNVTLNGLKIRDYNRENFYNKISYVSFNTFIFNASIRDNFKVAKSNISDEEIFTALKKVNLYDFAMENGGLDYEILEDSENISGGQRQRLAIAINLVNKKQIYIFDEATSNIDIESEKVIMDNIKQLSRDSIVIIISHRLANVTDCDNIYMLDSGAIIESGTHQELMAKVGQYHKLFSTQYNQENNYKEGNSNA